MALVQWLAIASMFIDHLGALSILGDWSRFIGRFALPAFVVMVAYNAYRTPKPDVMVSRLFVLFAISQPLWSLSVGDWDRLCILFTLLAVVLMVWCYRLRHYELLAVALVVYLLLSPLVEYGPLPLLLVPFAVRPSLLTLCLAIGWPFLQYVPGSTQLTAIVALVVLLLLVRFPFDVPRSPRWLSRWFYPVHLKALIIIKMV